MLRFRAEAGCRACGLADLRLGDLVNLTPDRRGRYRAIVREKGIGGRRKSRPVYFKSVTAQALEAYLEIRPEIDADEVDEEDRDHVWVTQQAGLSVRPLQEEGIYRMIERYATRLGITGKWNPHAWRHAYAHASLNDGADLGLVSQLMGHEDFTTTIRCYGRRADAKLAEEHARFSWVDDEDDLWPVDEDEDEEQGK